jgi:hypothetical protein
MNRICSFFRFFKPERFKAGHVSPLLERDIPVFFPFYHFAIHGSEYHIEVHPLLFSPVVNDRFHVIGWPVHDIHVLASQPRCVEKPCGSRERPTSGSPGYRSVAFGRCPCWPLPPACTRRNRRSPRSICFFIDSQAEKAWYA